MSDDIGRLKIFLDFQKLVKLIEVCEQYFDNFETKEKESEDF